MCLVHKDAVHAQLLKCDHVVFFLLRRQLLQLGLQGFFGLLHLLDGVFLSIVSLGVGDGGDHTADLLPDNRPLPLRGEGNLLKLTMADDHGVIVSGSDASAKLPAPCGLKILSGSHQHLRAGIQAQKIAAPLLRQVVRDDEQGFLTQAQALALHSGGNHLKG